MRALLAQLVVTASLGTAAADTFEAQASAAQRVRHVDDVVWALTATCAQGAEIHRRQCRLLRDARAQALAGATLLVEPEPGTLRVGPWSPARRSVTLTLSSCIRCSGVTIDGRTWHLTGAVPRSEAGALAPQPLYDSARVFSSEAAAAAWRASISTARVQLVVKVPDKRRWQVEGKDGLLLDVLGYRVIAPCTGDVVLAKPPSNSVPPDKQACGAPAAFSSARRFGIPRV